MKSKLVEQVINLEWQMFSAVQNVGGPASCQQSPETFRIMRASQADTWPEEVLESYLGDLREALEAGRNLMTEKYAWMMESTAPVEFERIKGALPAPPPETLPLLEEIVRLNVAWKLELAERYPRLTGKGRMIRTGEDGPFGTSFETYLRGELKTMSPRTLMLFHDFTCKAAAEGRNLAEENLLNQVRHYGYVTLEAAENRIEPSGKAD